MASLYPAGEPDPTALYRKIGDYFVDTNSDNMLGEGATGKVFPGYQDGTNMKIAAKKMLVLDEKEFIDAVELEATIMMSIPEHQNVIRIYAVEKERIRYKNKPHVNIWIFMEFCELGDLNDFCESTALDLDQKLEIMKQCALGLQHLHYCKQRVIHRDIKPQNILLSGRRESPVAKITDFGAAKFLEYNKEKNKTKSVHTFTGTLLYMAPELFSIPEDGEDPAYNQSVDVYSLGLSFLALLEAKVHSNLKPYEVNGVELGRHMWINRSTNYEPGIIRSGDSQQVKAVKAVIRSMLRLKSGDRCTSKILVNRISQLIDGDGAAEMGRETSRGGGIGNEVMVAIEGYFNRDVWFRKEDSWHVCAQLPPRCAAMYDCFFITNDMLVVVGGWDGYQLYSQCNALSLSTKTWSRLPDIPTARYLASAAVLGDDVIIVLGGGISGNKASSACESLHVQQNEWHQRANMPQPLSKPLIAVHGGLLYIVPHGDIKAKDRLMEYHPSFDYYREKCRLPPAVTNTLEACMVSCGSHLYLLGGEMTLGHQYNPDCNQWMQIAKPYLYYTGGSSAVVRDDNTILLCGGHFDENEKKRDLVEEYDHNKQCWKPSNIALPFSYMYFNSFVGIFNE